MSRPLVSRMLSEARELGVVEILIHEPGAKAASLLERLRLSSSIRSGILVEDGQDEDDTNQMLSQGAVDLLRQIGSRRLGVGWGYLIGQLVTWLEKNPQPGSTITDICPLVGNASIPARNYQSNENVRLMAQQLGATPHFLYLPALPDSLEEKQLLCSTEVYRQIHQQWEQIDTALVNIGDYPSSPDFASLVRLRRPAPAAARLRTDAGLLFQRKRHHYPIRSGLRHPDPVGDTAAVPQHCRCLLSQHQCQGPARRAPDRSFYPHRGPVRLWYRPCSANRQNRKLPGCVMHPGKLCFAHVEQTTAPHYIRCRENRFVVLTFVTFDDTFNAQT